MQELCIFFTVRLRLPSENLLFFSIYRSDNFWGGSCSPLTEQMGNLKIFHSRTLAHSHPPFKFFITKFIATICYGYVYKLNGSTLTTHCRIQRRCKDWCENHITSTFYCPCYKVFHNSPVFFTEYFHMIIICQTVAVEPFGMWNIQFRKYGIQHLQRNMKLTKFLIVICFLQNDFYRIFTCFCVSCRLQIHPQTSPLTGYQRKSKFRNI